MPRLRSLVDLGPALIHDLSQPEHFLVEALHRRHVLVIQPGDRGLEAQTFGQRALGRPHGTVGIQQRHEPFVLGVLVEALELEQVPFGILHDEAVVRAARARGKRAPRLDAFAGQVRVPLCELVGQQGQGHRLRLISRVHALGGVHEDQVRLLRHAEDARHVVVSHELQPQSVAIERRGAIEVAVVQEQVAGAHAEVAHGAEGRVLSEELIDAPRGIAEQPAEAAGNGLARCAGVLAGLVEGLRLGLERLIVVERLALVDEQDVLALRDVGREEVGHKQAGLPVELHLVAGRNLLGLGQHLVHLGWRQHLAHGKRLHAGVDQLAKAANGTEFIGVRRSGWRAAGTAGADGGDQGEQHALGDAVTRHE